MSSPVHSRAVPRVHVSSLQSRPSLNSHHVLSMRCKHNMPAAANTTATSLQRATAGVLSSVSDTLCVSLLTYLAGIIASCITSEVQIQKPTLRTLLSMS